MENKKEEIFSTNPWTEFSEVSRDDVLEKEAEISPKTVCEMMQQERLQPNGDYSKYEQTRQDAIALQGTFWAGRDFIHDRRPGIHGLFVAMTDMYDAYTTGDDDAYDKNRTKLEQLVDDNKQNPDKLHWTGFDGAMVLDINNYNEDSVEILRRLRDNTEINETERPVTGDTRIDSIIQNMYFNIDDSGENIDVDLRDAGTLAKELNDKLIESQGKAELSQNFIRALLFSDEASAFALRGLSKREISELPFDSNFKEIVKFSELTASPNTFNSEKFEHFWNSLESDFARNWGNDANYDKLALYVIDNVSALARQFREDGKPDFMIDSLWSGNLAHELIGLADKK